MSPTGYTLRAIAKRPVIVWFLGTLALLFLAVNKYNPAISILSGLGKVTKGDVFESIMSLLQIITELRMLVIMLLFIIGLSISSALLAGLIFSGYLKIVSNAVENKNKEKGQFASGFKKYFLKTLLMSFATVFLSLILLVFAAIASVPSIVTTRAALSGKLEFSIAALFIDVLTASVLFFGLMFFRIYFLFWYPAVFNDDEKPFTAGKKVADKCFWQIAFRFAAFDAFFAAAWFAVAQIKDPAAQFLVNWVFITFFLSFFITYIFSFYKAFR